MIVFVESNFILEIAYLQEQHGSCDELLVLGETAQISLRFPAFSVIEAPLSLPQRNDRRQRFRGEFGREVEELSRSKPYRKFSSVIAPLTAALLESGEEEKKRLDATLSRILLGCEVIPIQGSTVRRAIEIQAQFGLKSKDSTILAAILEDLEKAPTGPKLFLNRNSKDFANPDIYDELKKYECELLTSFDGGFARVKFDLAGGATAPVPPSP